MPRLCFVSLLIIPLLVGWTPLDMQPTVDLAVSVTTTAHPIMGQFVRHKVVIYNKGATAATGIQLQATLPAPGAEITPAEASNCTLIAAQFHCAFDIALPPHQSFSVNFNLTPDSATVLPFDVTVSANEADSDLSNNQAEAFTVVAAPHVDVQVSQTVNVAAATVGEPTFYTLYLDQTGPDTAWGITLVNPVPEGMQVHALSASPGVLCHHAADTITCAVAMLQPQTRVSVTVGVLPTTAGAWLNTAAIDLHTGLDANLDNNQLVSVLPVGTTSPTDQIYLPLVTKGL